jgi:hypothetical protein
MDHRNNIPSVIIYHLTGLEVLVVMPAFYFITHEATESES